MGILGEGPKGNRESESELLNEEEPNYIVARLQAVELAVKRSSW